MDEYIDYYLGLGLCIIPAYPRSKKPCVEWKIYQNRKPTDDEISEWMGFWRRGYNIGCIGGSVSDNLAVLDIDSDEIIGKFDMNKLTSKTMVVRTGSGKYHIYFRTPKPVRTIKFLDDSKRVMVEIRGEGSFNVLPPSIHPETGQQYVLLSRPAELPTIIDPAESIIKMFGLKPSLDSCSEPRGARVYRCSGYEPPCIRRLLDPRTKIPEGWRNEALIRVVSHFMQEGSSGEDLKVKAHAWNLAHCIPPLDDREVESVVKSILKHGYSYGCRGLKPVCSPNDRIKCRITKRNMKKIIERLEDMKIEPE